MSEKVKRGIAQTCNSFLSNREISFARVGCFEQIIWESHDQITGTLFKMYAVWNKKNLIFENSFCSLESVIFSFGLGLEF